MFRLIFRLFLLVYFVMPIVAGVLIIQTFAQVRSDVTPAYETARATITNATNTLDDIVRDLDEEVEPLVTSVNAARTALQRVLNFIQGTVYTLIDVVNGLNVACSIGGTACIPKSINLTLPAIVDLSFVSDISTNITAITTQVNSVVTTTTTAIASYMTMLTLAVGVLVAWIVLTFLLFVAALYSGLWKQAFSSAR